MSTEERSAAARYLGARGARVTNAKLTPEQRATNARKAGKASAAKRWGKGWVDDIIEKDRRQCEARAAKPEAVGGMFSAGAQQLERLGEAVGLKGAAVKACDTCGGSGASPGGVPCLGCEGTGSPEYLKVIGVDGHPIPERSPAYQAMIDKAKSEERAEGVSFPGDRQAPKPKRPLPKPGTIEANVLLVLTSQPQERSAIDARFSSITASQIRAALAHLTTAGHVVSEPKPGSRREKLWRLA